MTATYLSSAMFPAPFEGETVYSIFARRHVLTSNAADGPPDGPELTTTRSSRHHAVPTGMDWLTAASNHMLTSTEDDLRKRTLLGPYLTLLTTARRDNLLKACRESGSGARARTLAGLNKNSEPARLLKSCPTCIKEQRDAEGTSYWLASLQLPGVWLCPAHRRVLQYDRNSSRMPGWRLPHHVQRTAKSPHVGPDVVRAHTAIQGCILWIAQCDRLDVAVLRTMLRVRLQRNGLCRSELKWQIGELEHIDQLARESLRVVTAPDIAQINGSAWLRGLLDDPRQYNPLIWSMAMSFAGPVAPQDLTAEYRDALSRAPARQLFNPLARSARRAAAPSFLYEAFGTADTKKDAAEIAGVTPGELDGWLRKDPLLSVHWRDSRTSRRTEAALSTLRLFLERSPSCLRIDALRACSREYRWLEKHAPTRLEAMLPAATNHISRQLPLAF